MHLKPVYPLHLKALLFFLYFVFLSMIFVFRVVYRPDGPGVRFIIHSNIIYVFIMYCTYVTINKQITNIHVVNAIMGQNLYKGLGYLL